MDPFEFRLRNSLQPGQSKSTGRVVQEWPFPGAHGGHAAALSTRRQGGRSRIGSGKVKRGVGLGTGAFGIGGARATLSVAAVELDPDGGISVYAAAADPGEGNDSMLSQLTAEFMGIPLDRVRLHTRDTDNTAASGPAAGSRITYMIGNALIDALEQLKAAMQETGPRTSEANSRRPANPNAIWAARRTKMPVPWTPRPARAPPSSPRSMPCRWSSWRWTPKAARSRSSR